MEHFTASMRSRVFNDIDAGVPLANIHGSIARERDDAKFRVFQCECERLMYCYVKEEKLNRDCMYSYVIEDRVWKAGKGGIHEYLTPKRRMYHCLHKIKEKEIECSCKMFETHGILCRHAIWVLDMNLYQEPPEKYVLRRWRKDIRRNHALVEVCYHDPTKSENTKRFDKMNAFLMC
ncbi:Protein FAR1-RELATED SEQUENCE 6 [Bienertia sinuspersici]